MGASTFTVFQQNPVAGDAFRTAVSNAQYEDGHSGYSGTIAEKTSYRIVPGPALSMGEARAKAAALINTEGYWDKWGPAGAIRVVGGERLAFIGGAYVPVEADGWLFFGWASS